MQWVFADGLGVNSKTDAKSVGLGILILRQVARPPFSQVTPRGFIDRELVRQLHPRRFLYATGALSVHDVL